jgi:regulator of sigma E protease
MLRGKRKLSVIHADGTKETVVLPEKVEYELFQNGAYPAFELRSTNLTIDSIIPNKPADKAKIKSGDKLLSINGNKIEYYDNVKRELFNSRSNDAKVDDLRGKDTVSLTVKVPKEGIVGFVVLSKPTDLVDYKKVKTAYFGFGESISKGIHKGYNTLNDYAAQLKFLFTKKGATEIGGFARIGQMFPSVWNWQIFWMNTAFISIALAFMNILPIPALDGGHVVFLLYEMITGKEAPQKVLEYAQYVGFFLLIGLTLYANGLDVFRIFTGK